MVYVMKCSVKVGKAKFSEVHSIKIENSTKNLSDVCTIEVPTAYLQSSGEGKKLSEVVKEGDAVTVELGYNDSIRTEFVGYVRSLTYSTPFRIECEDEMFTLRKKPAKAGTYEHTMLDKFLVANGINATILFTSFLLDKFVVAQGWMQYDLLVALKKDPYNLYAYFFGGVLYIGFAYDIRKNAVSTTYHLSGAKNIISHSLDYMTAEGKKCKVKAISNLKNGKKIKVELGDSDGTATRTLNFFNLTQSELKTKADAELKRMKIAGYKGKLIAFGFPHMLAGGEVSLVDKKYPDRAGKYLVDGVNVIFGSGGYRREINISSKL